ncbi:MAG: hypothetical protein HY775_08465 [Acidobacteria bacterium]|nr:hypothetical protein [Acidobacteriota bacterium]
MGMRVAGRNTTGLVIGLLAIAADVAVGLYLANPTRLDGRMVAPLGTGGSLTVVWGMWGVALLSAWPAALAALGLRGRPELLRLAGVAGVFRLAGAVVGLGAYAYLFAPGLLYLLAARLRVGASGVRRRASVQTTLACVVLAGLSIPVLLGWTSSLCFTPDGLMSAHAPGPGGRWAWIGEGCSSDMRGFDDVFRPIQAAVITLVVGTVAALAAAMTAARPGKGATRA